MTLSSEPPLKPGNSELLGARVTAAGVSFCLYSKHASLVELLLFDQPDAAEPARVLELTPTLHRTYHYWHCFVAGIGHGQIYAFRVHGPWQPECGLRFNGSNLLLDPYGLAVVIPRGHERVRGWNGAGGMATAMKSVVVDPDGFDWEGDLPLRRPHRETIIYELHVRGFTRHPSSGVEEGKAGTYAGVIEKIPYLLDLGVTAVELMPVFQFDPYDAPPGRGNYWGYSPISLFSPHQGYSSGDGPLAAIEEFRTMVKALHRAGIEVILDVVFNHTAEGDQNGPSFCFKGLANEAYYLLGNDASCYADYTGCGNTLNANHPIVRRLIRHSLRYWVKHMHVDGFRFDLASVLARDQTGQPIPLPPTLWDIESDPLLAGIKLIAEAWDAAGLYQVGSFIGDSWQEWNGHFRDDVRRFLRGDSQMVHRVAMRVVGSPDVYGHEQREAEQSVNFITCHDGFTLADLVSYNDKHNQDNGEQNQDGTSDNHSWNCGAEGPTDDPQVLALRNRQARNFLTLLLVSIGTPMLLMGDEVLRTQAGNNNGYCQDNEIGWFDWNLVRRNADLRRFVRELIHHRLRRDLVQAGLAIHLNDLLRRNAIEWHGVNLREPDWGADSHSFALGASSDSGRFRFHLIANAWWEPLTFRLPGPEDGSGPWRRWINTAAPPPFDITPWQEAPTVVEERVRVEPRSIVLLYRQGNGWHAPAP